MKLEMDENTGTVFLALLVACVVIYGIYTIRSCESEGSKNTIDCIAAGGDRYKCCVSHSMLSNNCEVK